jgi:hypothetical protein
MIEQEGRPQNPRIRTPRFAVALTVAQQFALTYAATAVAGLAAQQAGQPNLIRSPKRVLAHAWAALLE